MNEIKIPEGHKATILGGTIRIEPIEEVQEQKFKRGDIVYARMSNGWSWVAIYDKYDEYNSDNPIVYKAILNIHDGEIRYNVNVCLDGFRIVTPEEQQILFDALAREGKYWDAKALEIKDFIKVPESIGIYKWFGEDEYRCGDDLFIGFNNDTQILGYDDSNKCYLVYPKRNDWQKVQCYLQPCKREDLKSGDTAFISRANNFCRHDMYYKKIDESEYEFVRVFDDGVRQVDIKSDYNIRFYKLIPING